MAPCARRVQCDNGAGRRPKLQGAQLNLALEESRAFEESRCLAAVEEGMRLNAVLEESRQIEEVRKLEAGDESRRLAEGGADEREGPELPTRAGHGNELPRAPIKLCRFWVHRGFCSKGERCAFVHDAPAAQQAEDGASDCNIKQSVQLVPFQVVAGPPPDGGKRLWRRGNSHRTEAAPTRCEATGNHDELQVSPPQKAGEGSRPEAARRRERRKATAARRLLTSEETL